jgi:predicted Rossmann fold flavoprotein
MGHTVVKVRAALAPMYLTTEGHDPAWSGVALREVLLKVKAGTKEISRWHGDLLFTHQGISGPCALGVSRAVAERMEQEPVVALVDLAPDLAHDELSSELQTLQKEHPKRRIGSLLETYVPERLVPALAAAAQLDLESTAWGMQAKARNRLVEVLKAWRLGPVRAVPLEKGEVVAGGVSLDEVDPRTMRSLKVPGLYLCGEILDIAGPVGGYNLQAAFSTGYVAGESAAGGKLD